jgi:hypothetical protein
MTTPIQLIPSEEFKVLKLYELTDQNGIGSSDIFLICGHLILKHTTQKKEICWTKRFFLLSKKFSAGKSSL